MSTVSVQLNLTQWGEAQSKVSTIFNQYESYQQTAYDLDFKAMKDEEDRLRDQMDSGMWDNSSDDLENFYKEVNKVWDEAKGAWKKFKDGYQLHFAGDIGLAGTMHEMKQKLQKDVYDKLGTFEQTLANSQIGTQWKGKGAEGYAKQIPVQTKAMTDLKQAADATRYAMEASSMVQQCIYLSVMTSVKRTYLTVHDLHADNTDDRWAERIYTMRDLNNGLVDWLEQMRDPDIAPWAGLQQDLLTKISETEDGYSELSSENWPAATAASTGYQPNTSGTPGTTSPQQPPATPPAQTPSTPAPTTPDGGMNTQESGGQQTDEEKYE